MGLEPVRESTSRKFIKPFRGYITSKPDDMIPGQTLMDFTIKRGDTEETFTKAVHNGVTGIIMRVKINTEGNYGPQLEIDLQDGMDSYCLQLNPEGGEAFDFYTHMLAVDLSKEVRFFHWQKKNKDGEKSKYYSLGMSQKGEEDKWVYCGYSWKMGEVPEWTKNALGKYNKDAAIDFYMKGLKELQDKLVKRPGAEPVGGGTVEKAKAMLDEDDLPF